MQVRLKCKLLPKLIGAPDGAPVKVSMPGEVADLAEAEALLLLATGKAQNPDLPWPPPASRALGTSGGGSPAVGPEEGSG